MSKAPPPSPKLNTDELRNSSPTPDLEVVLAAPESLSDQELVDEIQRVSQLISSGVASRLVDKGDRLRQNLLQLEIENDRRKLARFEKEDEEANRARSRGVPLLRHVPSPNYTMSEPRRSPTSRSPTVSLLHHVPGPNYSISELCRSPTSRSPTVSLLHHVPGPNYTISEPRQSPTSRSPTVSLLRDVPSPNYMISKPRQSPTSRTSTVSLLRDVPSPKDMISEPRQSPTSRTPTVSLFRDVPSPNYMISSPRQSPTSRTPTVSLLRDVPSPNYTISKRRQSPTFSSLFTTILRGKADDVPKEEPGFIVREKWGSLQGNKEHKHEGSHLNRAPLQPTQTLPEQSPYQCASSIAGRVTYRSSYGDRRSMESSKISSCHVGRSLLDSSSMKRKASERRESLHPRSYKVQHVVLLDEEEVQPTQQIHNDTYGEGKEAKIYYPSRDDPESVELCYPDIKCLDPEQLLSSPIMNFYIRYLQRLVSQTDETNDGYYFFNTYFYKKLDEAMSVKGDRSAHFLKLRRWWKGVNIFQKAYIFLPVHNGLHWSLVIICIPTKEEETGPVVLHLDSLGIHESVWILGVVGSYLEQEWNCIRQDDPPSAVPISEKIWNDLPRWIVKKTVRVPQQENVYDCGLFVLYFMELFIKEASKKFKKRDITSMFGESWFKPEDASGLRKRIRDLVAEEFESARLENGRQESSTSLWQK